MFFINFWFSVGFLWYTNFYFVTKKDQHICGAEHLSSGAFFYSLVVSLCCAAPFPPLGFLHCHSCA